MKTATISQKPFNPAHAALVPVALAKEIVKALVDAGQERLAAKLADASGHDYSPEQRAEVQALRDRVPASDGDLECDEDAPISFGDDPGAYVMCWKWVPLLSIEQGDEWQSGNWTGKVVGSREDTDGEKLVTVEDCDGDAFDIEAHRLAVCERA